MKFFFKLLLIAASILFIVAPESVQAGCDGFITCEEQTGAYRCEISGRICNPDIRDDCAIPEGNCAYNDETLTYTLRCYQSGSYCGMSCQSGHTKIGDACYSTPDCPPGTSYCAGCGSCMDTSSLTCTDWEASNCGLPAGETPPTGGDGSWGSCGSCSSCVGPSNECVRTPEGACVWDYGRCHQSGPSCRTGSFYFTGANDDYSNPCTDGGNDANCCAGYSCSASWSQSGCGMRVDEFGNEYYACDNQGWSGSCNCIAQCAPRCGQPDQCGSTCSSADAAEPTVSNILPSGEVYVDQTASVTITWNTTNGNTYSIALAGSGGSGEDTFIEAYVTTRSYTFTADRPHYDVSIQAINTTCSAYNQIVPGVAATASFDVMGLVTGQVIYDSDATAAISGDLCADLDAAGFNPGSSSTVTGDDRQGSTFTANVDNDGTYQLGMPLSSLGGQLLSLGLRDLNYTCVCPAGCSYLSTSSPASGLNFFVVDATDPWFQAEGGPVSAYATAGMAVQSLISPFCQLPECEPSLIRNQNGSTTEGYVLTGGGDIDTSYVPDQQADQIDENRHNWFARLNDTPNHQDYAYFVKLLRLPLEPESDFGASSSNASKPTGNVTNDGARAYYHTGDLTIGTNWDVAADESIVVLVDGNVNVSAQTSVAEGGFLMIVASGNVIFSPDLGHDDATLESAVVEGVFVADGQIMTPSRGEAGGGDRKFVGEGTFVGWSGFVLERDFDDGLGRRRFNNTNPVEYFRYRPDLLKNAPDEIKRPQYSWREINP